MSPPEAAPTLDADVLYERLLDGVRHLVREGTEVMGVWSGGVWLAERLVRDLGREGRYGVISSALHRDDFGERGLSGSKDPTRIPFSVDGAHIVLVDDVLYTGRTIRAVLNELFDFGRPASVTLAVLIDRGGRELPIEAAVVAEHIALPPDGRVCLAQGDDGHLTLSIEHAGGETATGAQEG